MRTFKILFTFSILFACTKEFSSDELESNMEDAPRVIRKMSQMLGPFEEEEQHHLLKENVLLSNVRKGRYLQQLIREDDDQLKDVNKKELLLEDSNNKNLSSMNEPLHYNKKEKRKPPAFQVLTSARDIRKLQRELLGQYNLEQYLRIDHTITCSPNTFYDLMSHEEFGFGPYSKNYFISWTFHIAPDVRRMVLHCPCFRTQGDFNTVGNPNCTKDHFSIYSPLDASDYVYRQCGFIPGFWLGYTEDFRIEFSTDGAVQRSGFYCRLKCIAFESSSSSTTSTTTLTPTATTSQCICPTTQSVFR